MLSTVWKAENIIDASDFEEYINELMSEIIQYALEQVKMSGKNSAYLMIDTKDVLDGIDLSLNDIPESYKNVLIGTIVNYTRMRTFRCLVLLNYSQVINDNLPSTIAFSFLNMQDYLKSLQ